MADQYDTKLSPTEEEAFKAWKQKNAPKDSGQDYDLRGAYKAGISADPKSHHWPDTYKKPNHPTFSVESKYATGNNRAKAGHWVNGNFVGPPAELPLEERRFVPQLSNDRASSKKKTL